MNLTSMLNQKVASRCILTLLAMGLGCMSAEAAVIYSQDFSSVSSGWTIGTVTQGTVSFAAGAGSGAPFPTRSLELSHVPANTTRLTSSMPLAQYSIPKTSPDTYTFQFDLRLSRADSSGWVTFLDSNTTSQLPMFVQITPAGAFQVGYWTGSANATLTLLSGYTVNTTYSFTFTTTPSTGLFSASVTNGTASLINQGYRRTSGGLSPFQNFNWMQIYNDGGSAGGSPYDIYVDNISIQSVPEPGVTACVVVGGLALGALRRRRK